MTNRDRILAKKLIEYVNKNRPLQGATAAQVYEQIRELCGKYGYNLPSFTGEQILDDPDPLTQATRERIRERTTSL
jgi:hypothetical protein